MSDDDSYDSDKDWKHSWQQNTERTPCAHCKRVPKRWGYFDYYYVCSSCNHEFAYKRAVKQTLTDERIQLGSYVKLKGSDEQS
jgi:predicted SprT family Zn-dependent metalloprotease